MSSPARRIHWPGRGTALMRTAPPSSAMQSSCISDGVSPCGHGRAGEDARCRAGLQAAPPALPAAMRCDTGSTGAGLRHVGTAQGVAVHRAVVLGRHVQRRDRAVVRSTRPSAIPGGHRVAARSGTACASSSASASSRGLSGERGHRWGAWFGLSVQFPVVVKALALAQQPGGHLSGGIEVEHRQAGRHGQFVRRIGGNGHDEIVLRIAHRARCAAGLWGAPDFDLEQVAFLEAFDQHPVHALVQLGEQLVHRSARSAARTRASAPGAGRTPPPPRRRRPRGGASCPCRRWSMSKLWCACLTTETRWPRMRSAGISFSTSVVLPQPEKPAKPTTFMRTPDCY
jgi:hypothetical protein